MKPGYRWIEQAIEKLDPKRDYEEIVRLQTSYRIDEFVLNLAYAINFMCVMIAPQGAEALMHTRKVVNNGQRRFNDSVDFLLSWYLLGPSHPFVKESVGRLNRIHTSVARQIPANFSDNDDYLIALGLIPMFEERLRRRVGLAGLSPKMKQVYHIWLRELSKLFSTGTTSGSIDGYPDDFDGLERFVVQFESRDFPPTANGHQAAEALIRQFCENCFPRGLRWLGRDVVLTFTPAKVRHLHCLGDARPLISWLVRIGLRGALVLKERVMPDPKISILEKRARSAKLSPTLERVRTLLRATPAVCTTDHATVDDRNPTMSKKEI